MAEGKTSPSRFGGRYGKLAAAAALASALLVMILACGDRNVYKPPPPPKVTVSQPQRKPVTDYLEFTGNAVAFQTVQLRARVEGFLQKILFQDGETVPKGKLVFLIEQDQYKAQLQKAEASVLAEKAQLEHAQTEFDRYSRLVKEKAAPQTEMDRWHYERDSRRAGLMAAQAQVELAKLNLGYTQITAPFPGRMGRHLKDPGDLVGAGEKTLLAEINQIDPIYVYFNINEQDLLRVRGKEPPTEEELKKLRIPVLVGLSDEPGFPHRGYLDFAAISLNPTTGSLMLRGILRNPKAVILPGLFVRVRVPADEEKPALLVPETALGFDQMGPYVRVVNEKNIVERRGVKLGIKVGTEQVILEGLKESDWLVVEGLLRAIPGKAVTPGKQEAPPQAGSADSPQAAAGPGKAAK
jgi:RND family efflux transporter MFP subunit